MAESVAGRIAVGKSGPVNHCAGNRRTYGMGFRIELHPRRRFPLGLRYGYLLWLRRNIECPQ